MSIPETYYCDSYGDIIDYSVIANYAGNKCDYCYYEYYNANKVSGEMSIPKQLWVPGATSKVTVEATLEKAVNLICELREEVATLTYRVSYLEGLVCQRSDPWHHTPPPADDNPTEILRLSRFSSI